MKPISIHVYYLPSQIAETYTGGKRQKRKEKKSKRGRPHTKGTVGVSHLNSCKLVTQAPIQTVFPVSIAFGLSTNWP